MKVVVHLVGGESLAADHEDVPVRQSEVDSMKEWLKQTLSEGDSWELSLSMADGRWAIIPGDKVLWVEFQS